MKKNVKAVSLIAILALSLSVFLAGCNPNGTSTTPKGGGGTAYLKVTVEDTDAFIVSAFNDRETAFNNPIVIDIDDDSDVETTGEFTCPNCHFTHTEKIRGVGIMYFFCDCKESCNYISIKTSNEKAKEASEKAAAEKEAAEAEKTAREKRAATSAATG